MATTPTPNPATSPLSVDEFASRIKTKYPEYAGLDNATLASKVVAKYPEYKGKVALPAQANADNTGIVGPDQSAPNAGLAPPSGSPALAPMKEWEGGIFKTDPTMINSGPHYGEPNKDFHQLPGVSEGAGAREALAGYTDASGGEVLRGLGNISQGLYNEDLTRVKQGTHQAISGAGTAMLPTLPIIAPAAPIPTMVSAALGYGTGKAARVTSKAMGGDEDTQNLAEDAGNILGGALGAKSGSVLNKLRPKASNQIVGPVVKKPVGQVLEDVKFGKNPAKAITDEGLVGTEDSLLKQADARTKQLSAAIDNKLQTHPNAGSQIDAGPIIDEAINNAVSAARKTGNSGIETRLEALRTALKSEYGPIKGTPYEINQLKRQVGEVGSELGAFKTADPVEASAASAMADVYGGLKRAVNGQVPDVAPLNERVGNLISAKAALRRNIALGTNKSAISGMSATNFPFKIAEKTLLSPLARTVAARVVNAGNKLGVPEIVQGATGGGPTPPTTPSIVPPTNGNGGMPPIIPSAQESAVPALIRDYVNGTEHPDVTAMKNATAHNSPSQAAEFNERGAQQLFGRPYGTLSVPERLQAIRKGTELQTEAMRTDSASGHSNIGGGSLEELNRGTTLKINAKTGVTGVHGGSIDIGNGEAVLRQRPDGSLEVANNNSGLRDSEILARFGRNAAETYGKPGRAPNTIELIHSSGEHGDVPLNRVSDYLASGHYRLAPRR